MSFSEEVLYQKHLDSAHGKNFKEMLKINLKQVNKDHSASI